MNQTFLICLDFICDNSSLLSFKRVRYQSVSSKIKKCMLGMEIF